MSKNEDLTNKNGTLSKGKQPIKKNVLSGMNINKLSNMRIIQKHLVYVIGLSSGIANKETLGKYEYFGQYGNILKIVVNKTKAYNPNGPNGPSFSAYISYSTAQEASIAILAIDNIEVDDHILRASYGTTKYCTFFLKNCDCPNKDCLYLHYLADDNDIVNRDDMNSNTSIFYDQQILAIKLADLFNTEIKKKLKTPSKKKTVFPYADTIYNREIVMELNPIKEEKNLKNLNGKNKKKYNDEYYDNYFNSEYDNNSNFHDNSKKNLSTNKFIELEKKENENFSDNNYNITREKSENLVNLTKNKSSINDQLTPTNSKFISKSKSPINMKKKGMNLKEELNEKDSKNSNNIYMSPNSSCKLIVFENENTVRKEKDKKENFSTNLIRIDSFSKDPCDKNINKINEDNKEEVNNTETNNEVLKINLEKIPVNKPKLKLYRKWDKSRFSFANKKEIETNTINLSFSDDKNQKNADLDLNKINVNKDENKSSNNLNINNGQRPNNTINLAKVLTLNNIINNKCLNEKNSNKKLENSNTIEKVNSNNEKNSVNILIKSNGPKAEHPEISELNDNKIKSEESVFEERNTIEETDIVPDYVYDVIRKKISRHTFFKKFEKEFSIEETDYFYFEKELNRNDSWSKFIVNNLEKPKIK